VTRQRGAQQTDVSSATSGNSRESVQIQASGEVA